VFSRNEHDVQNNKKIGKECSSKVQAEGENSVKIYKPKITTEEFKKRGLGVFKGSVSAGEKSMLLGGGNRTQQPQHDDLLTDRRNSENKRSKHNRGRRRIRGDILKIRRG